MDLKDFAQQYLNVKLSAEIQVTGLTDSTRIGTLSFLDNVEFIDEVKDNKNIVAVLVKSKDSHLIPDDVDSIIVDSPKSTFFDMHNAYCQQHLEYGVNDIAQTARIHPSAIMASEGVKIGKNVVIGAHSTILSGVEIGDFSTIGSNCVIGYDGFHVYNDKNCIKQIVYHDGKVIIGSNVDIQASVTIDKGLMGRDTVIGNECKVDNATHISHRVHIGDKTLITSGVCVAGSAEIGKNVWIGPHSVISNRVNICDNARILIGSVVISNITRAMSVSGNFAVEHILHLRSLV